jgi:methyl-accepting chemotaxis protein
LPKSIKPISAIEPEIALLRERILKSMRIPGPVIVEDRYQFANGEAASTEGRVDKGVMIEMPLKDGHWLLFATRFEPPSPFDPVAANFNRASFAAWLSLSILLGILLSILAARRLVKPLSRLAMAVEQLGGSGEAPPLIPRGPREVQATILAFNRMQERLRRFNDDRTRMIATQSNTGRRRLSP